MRIIHAAVFALLSWGVQAQPSSSKEFDRALALDPNTQGTSAAIRVLRDYAQRGEGEAGFAWWMKLSLSVRSRLSQSSELMLWRNRVEFLRDANRGDGRSCAVSGRNVLRHPMLGCDYAQELRRYLDCAAATPRSSDTEAFMAKALQRLDRDTQACGAERSRDIAEARAALAGSPAP